MRPRPLYDARSPLPAPDVLVAVRSALESGRAPCSGHVGLRHLNLHIADGERHLWSPWICIEVTPEDTGSRLRGYFGPHPSLWGIFTAVYAIQVFLFLAAVMYGSVSAWLDMGQTGLWIALVLLLSLALSCGLNLAGEWMGAPQMKITREFLARTVSATPS